MPTSSPTHHTELQWIDTQQAAMLALVQQWAEINSSSDNLDGLAHLLLVIKERFARLDGEIDIVDLPPRHIIDSEGQLSTLPHGQALHIIKRPEAKTRIFLGGHMDTVYPLTHPFQKTKRLDDNTLCGPGVADMKGGLVIMLTALEALEQSPFANNIGWEVVINPDEEIGSMGSEQLFIEGAKRNTLGLIFEPSFHDGAIVGPRKGSANMTVIARGKAAHAGRDFDKGCNAITALARFIVEADKLNDAAKGITVNIGQISGGGPVNVVPDFALCRINARAKTVADFNHVQQQLQEIAESIKTKEGPLTYHLQQAREPKVFDEHSQALFAQLNICAKQEGYELIYRASGGVCDGNILAAHGLPVIDTLGVIGAEIHTPNEYMRIDSLVSRARLVALFLMKLAAGNQ